MMNGLPNLFVDSQNEKGIRSPNNLEINQVRVYFFSDSLQTG